MKRFIYAGLLAVMLVMPGWAWAQCWVTYPDGTVWESQTTAGIKEPILFNTPGFNVSFNPNVPNGTILFDKVVDFYNVRWGEIGCTGGLGYVAYVPRPRTSKTFNWFPTSIPGVEMSVAFADSNRWAITTLWGSVGFIKTPPGSWNQLRIFFRKSGPITEGGTISGLLGAMEPKGRAVGVFVEWRIDGNIVIDPQVPTCRVTTPAITVPLGNMPASTFTGVGTPSPSKPFNIELECSGIETGKNLNVYTTLTDHTNPGNVSDTLTLAKDSTATGIGIQVLNGSTVVKYGPDSSAIGNKNQWKAGAAGNGTFTIPLTARYVQTAPKITPGTANGLATFTMSYQ
ncbi:fimbrial protein [Burkholderia stagnalis]|uniref:fimbrial protein n=1 Tax=Burkholderia stagnalis TaxID=1503054 RepID=UPI002AB35316|nr:fimbrial protein [Burkholderia stagnalis]MDY7804736.1 fimbrial protein [Burkholderia stagnalis]